MTNQSLLYSRVARLALVLALGACALAALNLAILTHLEESIKNESQDIINTEETPTGLDVLIS